MSAREMVWPELGLTTWADTKGSLHLSAQILGKLRLALSPPQPNWMFTALALTARGVTTGTMPWADRALQATIDVFASEITLELSDGRSVPVALLPPRPVADVFAGVRAGLEALGIDVALTTVPQEVADLTPLDADRRMAAYDPAHAQRWFAVVTAVAGIFERWRSHFFGRSGIALWWGAFDLSLTLFSGRHVDPPADRGYLRRYEDAELLSAGFFPGDEAHPEPTFYGYIYPQPPNCSQLDLGVDGVSWSPELGEWVLAYDTFRASPDPARTLRAFLDALYDACGSVAGWDRAALSYEPPPRPARR